MSDAINKMMQVASEMNGASGETVFDVPDTYQYTTTDVDDNHYQVGRLSITHEAIIDWLVANPGKGQKGRCALVFGISRAWLSTLIHSDAFQAVLKEKQDVEYNLNVVPLKDKIVGVAHEAVDKLGESLGLTNDPKLLLEVADKMLHRLGYAPKVGVTAGGNETNNVQNNYYVSPELLAHAREKTKQGDLSHEGEVKELPAPKGILSLPECNMGEDGSESAGILIPESE